jgi:hypothetical protein
MAPVSLDTATRLARTRVPLFHEVFPLVILWSENSGCTTVLKWFLWHIGLYEAAVSFDPWVHGYEQQVFKKRSGYLQDVTQALVGKTKTIVKVVRDPRARAVSAFFGLGGPATLNKAHWSRETWEQCIQWKRSRGLPSEPDVSFGEFLEFVSDKGFFRKLGTPVNRHLMPQYVRGEEFVVDTYLPIERFADWSREVEQSCGLGRSDTEFLSSSIHHKSQSAHIQLDPQRFRVSPGRFADRGYPPYTTFFCEPKIASAFGVDLAAYSSFYR